MLRRLWLGLVVLQAACGGEPPVPPAASPPTPAKAPDPVIATPLPPLLTSDKAKVTLTLSKRSYFLGENILVDYCITNTRKTPLEISVGGDYRGASRSLRFELSMTDGRGVRMDDPDPARFSEGGLGWSPRLAPGESWCKSLPLVRYARFDQPGAYTLRVVHDLGWPRGTAPEGETTLTLTSPDAAEAEGVIRAMEALPKPGTGTSGKTDPPWLDYSALRYPIYLAPLLSRAQAGNKEALEGLGQIPTFEATRALVTLLGNSNLDVAREAADELDLRLPDPALKGVLGPRNPFFNELPEQRKYLGRVAWRPELADEVRAAARRLLASPDGADMKHGAFMLEAVGTKDDAPVLVAALTTAIDRTATTLRESGIAPTPREACQELMRATDVLVIRGLPPPSPPATTGDFALWLVANKRAGTTDDAIYARALAHPNAYVRRVAMERAPEPLAASHVALVRANIHSADIDTQLAAISLAEERKLTALAPDAVAIITQTNDSYLFTIATNAARQLGARETRIDALIGRLTGPKLAYDALDRLLEMFGNDGRSAPTEMTPDVARKVQGAWRAFALKHRADIQADRALPLDASTPIDLVPAGFIVNRSNQPNWPPGR